MSVKSGKKLRYVATFFAVLLVVGIAERTSVGGNGCQTQSCTYCCSVTSCVVYNASNYCTYSPAGALNDCADTLNCQGGNPINLQQATLTYYVRGTATLDCPADGYTGPGTGAGGTLYQQGNSNLFTACGKPQT